MASKAKSGQKVNKNKTLGDESSQKSPAMNSGRNVNSSSNYNGNTAFALQQIQRSLDSINNRLSSYDTLVQNVEAIKGEIWY